MEIGDVYAVEIPASDGHEQAGARPALSTSDELSEGSADSVRPISHRYRIKSKRF